MTRFLVASFVSAVLLIASSSASAFSQEVEGGMLVVCEDINGAWAVLDVVQHAVDADVLRPSDDGCMVIAVQDYQASSTLSNIDVALALGPR